MVLRLWRDFPIAVDSTFLVDECNFCGGIPRNSVGEDLVADMVIGA